MSERTTAEIIADLHNPGEGPFYLLMAEAGDRLEELEAENARLLEREPGNEESGKATAACKKNC